MQKNFEIQAYEAVIEELLDLMTNDSENLERMLKLFTDECAWRMDPAGLNTMEGRKKGKFYPIDRVSTHSPGWKTKIPRCGAWGKAGD